MAKIEFQIVEMFGRALAFIEADQEKLSKTVNHPALCMAIPGITLRALTKPSIGLSVSDG